jgi:hypothetical protein
MKPLRILVGDDHDLVRRGCERCSNRTPTGRSAPKVTRVPTENSVPTDSVEFAGAPPIGF